MKRETQKEIHNFYMTHSANYGNVYLLDKAFEIYAANEIEDWSDLERASQEFCNFVLDNPYLFEILSVEELCFAVPYEIAKFKAFIESNINPQEKEEFVSAANELLVGGAKTKTLDIGAGQIPIGSMLLAKDHSSVTAMDKFFLSDETIKRFNVEPRNEYLTPQTDLGDYEMLIGNTPCDATTDMIKLAAKYNLPYFIRFCNCGLPQNGKRVKPAKNWQRTLKDIDPRLRIFTCKSAYRPLEKFGYVGPMPDDEVKKILASSYKMESKSFENDILDFLTDLIMGKKK